LQYPRFAARVRPSQTQLKGSLDMSDVQRATGRLFASYLTAWNARDFEGIAACYAEPCVFVLPGQTVTLPDRATLTAFFENMLAGLDAGGFSHTAIGSVDALQCADGMAVANTRNVNRLRADGSIMEAIDGHYVLKRIDGNWRIAVAVRCDQGWRQKRST
jgi:uncharacterized protein (TIGR02246 family)